MNENALTATRTPEIIAGEIRMFTASMLNNVIEIGRRMVEVKELLPHGSFGTWIKENTGYSQSTANNFMRLYQEYGADQGCLFGAETKSQTFGNLSYTKALALLAVPESERESFAKEHDVEAMSTRELQQAIHERDEARKQAEELRREIDELEDGHSLAMAELTDRIREMEDDAVRGKKALEERSKLLDRISMAEQTEKGLKDQIRELEERPIEVAVQRDEKAIEDAAREARAKAEAEAAEKINALQKKLDKAESARDKLKDAADRAEAGAAEKIAAAEREAAAAKEEMERLRKQLAASDKDVTAFILFSKQAQEAFGNMFAKLNEICERDPATAQKLNAGTVALLKKLADRCTAFGGKSGTVDTLPGQTELGGVRLCLEKGSKARRSGT